MQRLGEERTAAAERRVEQEQPARAPAAARTASAGHAMIEPSARARRHGYGP
jgi:hypothetical protein